MLTEEDLQQIKNVFENIIKKLETERKLLEDDKFKNSLNDIINRTIKWHDDNIARKKDIINRRPINGSINLDEAEYVAEELKELRTMYKNIVELLKL